MAPIPSRACPPDLLTLSQDRGCGAACLREIGQPLVPEDLQTLREALWTYERANNVMEPTCFQQYAYTHLAEGGTLRVGDFMSLHGSLLAALRPDTYALARKWQRLVSCAFGQAEGCVTD